ncbi:unnamed protein product, partial [Effrenium voratum]
KCVVVGLRRWPGQDDKLLCCSKLCVRKRFYCRQAACAMSEAAAEESTTVEEWPVVLVETAAQSSGSLPERMLQQWSARRIGEAEHRACEGCGVPKTVEEDTCATAFGKVICFTFPRNGAVADGRQLRNDNHVVCPEALQLTENKQWRLAGLVLHMAASESADGGHFTAWLRDAASASWIECDDVLIKRHARLPTCVEEFVIQAWYTPLREDVVPESAEAQRASATNHRPDGQLLGMVACKSWASDLRRVLNHALWKHKECRLRVLDAHNVEHRVLCAERGELETTPAADAFPLRVFGLEAVQATDAEAADNLPDIAERPEEREQAQEAAGLLPEHGNGEAELEAAVTKLLDTYRSREDCLSVLAEVPDFSCEIAGVSWEVLTQRLQQCVPEYVKSKVTGAVMREMPDLSPGLPGDGFHIQPVSTHAAAIDRLQETQGYQFFGASEGGAVQWQTAVERQQRRRDPNNNCKGTEAGDDRTNVSVIILQQVSLFSHWWAMAEDRCSIGLAGRCVFSFAAAGEPAPPEFASFGADVAIPVLKNLFRLLLSKIGPHAPIASDNPVLSWSCSEEARAAVHGFRVVCHELTQTLGGQITETFASGLNKSGYWLACVSFWTSLLGQLWPAALSPASAAANLRPQITDVATKLAMEFFTSRFLFGVAVLSADIRQRTWLRRRIDSADTKRWSQPALLLLRGSCGVQITPPIARRAGPMFRHLGLKTEAGLQAAAVYAEALQYLADRGFGAKRSVPDEDLPIFVKRHYLALPASCERQLADGAVHPIGFGLHCPWRKAKEDQTSDGTWPRERIPIEALELKCPEFTAEHTDEQLVQEEAEQEEAAAETPCEPPAKRTRRTINYETISERPTELASSTRMPAAVHEVLRKNALGAGFLRLRGQPTRSNEIAVMSGACDDRCQGCTLRVRAVLLLRADGSKTLRVSASGEHGVLATPQGGRIFTQAEEALLQAGG